jgi:uncharacterized protein YdhG (YjbR/CyaY superfamily)
VSIRAGAESGRCQLLPDGLVLTYGRPKRLPQICPAGRRMIHHDFSRGVNLRAKAAWVSEKFAVMRSVKKTNVRNRSSRVEPNRRAPTTVDAYVSCVSEPARGVLRKMRAAIRAVVPRDAAEIISYGMPAFRRDGVLVWYAAFADHCSLFPGAAVLEQFTDELVCFKTSKGTVQFPLDQRLPTALITRIVKARVAGRERKKRR